MFFPYDDYIHASSESEWKDDVKRKNNIVKYINILTSSADDYGSFYKFCNTAIFFRNVFCKEAFMFFYLNKFDETERKLLGSVVFDMFVKSKKGYVGNHEKFFKMAVELYKDVEYNTFIDKNYKRILTEIEIL